MSQLINEAKRFQKLAGILKEEISPEKIEFKGTDGILQIKLYIDGYAKKVSIFEACIGDKRIFCIKDDTSNIKKEFDKMKCEEIFSKLFSLYLSGRVYDHHGGKTQQSFKCGDFSKGFDRQGY